MIREETRITTPDERVESLYRAHRDRLWRAVFAFTGDGEVASDAVSEAFAQALRRGEGIRDPLPWVWRSAFRIAAGELKERRSRGVSGGSGLEPQTAGPDPGAMDLFRALARLTAGQRAALILHHYAGYPVREAAAILGSTRAAVQMHLVRGRRRLRELLEDDDG
jgi:RNA polymerase sigma-70 factor (ECF subfamily)